MAKTASSSSGSADCGAEETMVNGARRIRRCNRAAVPFLPDELVLWEILVRVQAKELLRCRAACRSWRRITSDPAFLLAHHRHQPSLPLVAFPLVMSDDDFAYDTVDALDLRQFPAVRRPVLRFNDRHKSYPDGFTIHASCDGLLLLSFSNHRRLHLCSPATRQWLTLGELPGDSYVSALYPHHRSGEYRVLYWQISHTGDSAVHYVLTVGSSSPEGQKGRCIGLPDNDPTYISCVPRSHSHFVLLHDCLHWYNRGKIVVFDTVVESFRLMQPPTATRAASPLDVPHPRPHVLQMDGTLGIGHVDFGTMTAEAWVLQDHEKEIWSSKFRIKLPAHEMRKADATCVDSLNDGAVVSENGDVMLATGGNCPSFSLFHCDGKGKLVQTFICRELEPEVLGLCFKESLVRHAFFKRKGNGRRVRMPHYLRGLY